METHRPDFALNGYAYWRCRIDLLVRFQIVDMDSSDIFQDTGPDGGVEEYEEELTAAEVLQKLEDAWLNEKHSPELLEPKMEIVECMLEQVDTIFSGFA